MNVDYEALMRPQGEPAPRQVIAHRAKRRSGFQRTIELGRLRRGQR